MTQEQMMMRLRALELAHGGLPQGGPVIPLAEQYLAFLTGEKVATQREIIETALDKAGVK